MKGLDLCLPSLWLPLRERPAGTALGAEDAVGGGGSHAGLEGLAVKRGTGLQGNLMLYKGEDGVSGDGKGRADSGSGSGRSDRWAWRRGGRWAGARAGAPPPPPWATVRDLAFVPRAA